MGGTDKIDVEIFKVIGKAIAASDNLEIMATHLCQLLVAALDIKGSALFVLNPSTKELELLASVGLSVSYQSKGPVMADKSMSGFLEGKSVVIRDIANDQSLQYPEEAKREGISAMVSIPVILSSELLGVMRLYHYEIWDISDQDMDSLRLLAEHIGLAMKYVRLLNATRVISETLRELPLEGMPT